MGKIKVLIFQLLFTVSTYWDHTWYVARVEKEIMILYMLVYLQLVAVGTSAKLVTYVDINQNNRISIDTDLSTTEGVYYLIKIMFGKITECHGFRGVVLLI